MLVSGSCTSASESNCMHVYFGSLSSGLCSVVESERVHEYRCEYELSPNSTLLQLIGLFFSDGE